MISTRAKAVWEWAKATFRCRDRADYHRPGHHQDGFRPGSRPRGGHPRSLPFIAAQAPGAVATTSTAGRAVGAGQPGKRGNQDRGSPPRTHGKNAEGGTSGGPAFKLLARLYSPDRRIYLRHDEAIKRAGRSARHGRGVRPGAAETNLAHLIRGPAADAHCGETARWRTIQYADQLAHAGGTRRDVRARRLAARVPDLIEDALSHMKPAPREAAILTNIHTRHGTRPSSAARKNRRRASSHRQGLQCSDTATPARLQRAGPYFRAEQDRQQFSGTAQRATVDLFGQLLRRRSSCPSPTRPG